MWEAHNGTTNLCEIDEAPEREILPAKSRLLHLLKMSAHFCGAESFKKCQSMAQESPLWISKAPKKKIS